MTDQALINSDDVAGAVRSNKVLATAYFIDITR
jgi:hypothetical protein